MDRLDTVETYIRQICNDNIEPPLLAKIVQMNLPDSSGQNHAIIKDVPRSLFVHKSHDGYFHRLGSPRREMTPQYLARLFQQCSQVRMIHLDEQEVPGTTFNDLDEKLWKRFITAAEKNPRLTLQKMRILVEDSTRTE